jgi:hypothetical protein
MSDHLTTDQGGVRRRAGLAVVGLLAATVISPLALGSMSEPARDATASALARAFQEAGLVCAITDMTAVSGGQHCVSVSRSRAPWFRLMDASQN